MTAPVLLDRGAEFLISLFERGGFSVYAVGGCVRDFLLNRRVSDIDLAVSASPRQSKTILESNGIQCVETGAAHGTVTAVLGGRSYEITTFRTDGAYSDNRRPDSVSFVRDINADLSRRDYTINAMAYNPKSGIIDLYGGMADLERGVIRAVGNPDKRFSEDSLRIVRGLRFASQLGFDIEAETAQAMLKKSPLLKNIARERMTAELLKLLSGESAASVLEKYKSVVLCMSVEFPRLVADGLWHYAVSAFSLLPAKPDLRLAALILFLSQSIDIKKRTINPVDITDVGAASRILRTFRLKSLTVRYIMQLMRYADKPEPNDMIGIKKMMAALGNSFYIDLLTLRCAVFGALGASERCMLINKIIDTVRGIDRRHEIYRISELDINGDDLKNMGYSGRQIGELLDTLLNLVMSSQLENSRESIVNYILNNK